MTRRGEGPGTTIQFTPDNASVYVGGALMDPAQPTMYQAPDQRRPLTQIDVVAAVVIRDGRFLLCRRPAHKRHGNLWEFPGGKVLHNESLIDALRREVAEELSLSLTSGGRVLAVIEDPGSPFVIHFVEATCDGEPILSEHEAFVWADRAAALELQLAPSDARFLAELETL